MPPLMNFFHWKFILIPSFNLYSRCSRFLKTHRSSHHFLLFTFFSHFPFHNFSLYSVESFLQVNSTCVRFFILPSIHTLFVIFAIQTEHFFISLPGINSCSMPTTPSILCILPSSHQHLKLLARLMCFLDCVVCDSYISF